MHVRLSTALMGLALTAALSAVTPVASAQTQGATAGKAAQDPPKRKPDLGDAAEGTYMGEIISDSRGGSSAAGTPVTITIRRIGVNKIDLATDNPLLRGGQYSLESAMRRILARNTKSTVLIDPTKSPTSLDYSPDEVLSFSGTRR